MANAYDIIRNTKEATMKINVFSSCWGKYLDYYYRYALPSIMPSVERLRNEGHTVEMKLYQRDQNLPRFPDCICHDIIDCMSKCIEENAYFFLLMPDTLYGAETLYFTAKYAEHRHIYVAWAHYRFNTEDVEAANLKMPMTNFDLMNALWPYPHKSTVDSNIDLPQNSVHTRQSSRVVDDYTFVNHGYPTIYLFKPDNGDIKCWQERARRDWIWYDTGYFSYAVSTQRVRIIGSADVAFCGELEPRNSHINECKTRNYNDIIPGRGDYSDRMLMTTYVIPRAL